MKISELDYSKLTEEDMYNLIMSGLVDYSTQNPTEETKADAITELYQSGMEFGLDADLLKQAMSEIISNQKDTPAVKEVLDQIEQLAQQQMEQANQQMDEATETLMASPQGQVDLNAAAQELEGSETTMMNQMELPREA